MRTEIMENVLGLLDRKLPLEGRKVIFFLDNAPCHSETLQNNLTNMKLIFLPKCTKSRLHPLHAGIIRAFKCKYRKLLMKYVVSPTDEGEKVLKVINYANIAQKIHWLQVAWKDTSTGKIVHCFQKCGFKKSEAKRTCKNSKIDEEFVTLLNQLRDDDSITVEDFITLNKHRLG